MAEDKNDEAQVEDEGAPEGTAEAAPAAVDPLAGGTDALLSMFAHDENAAQDLTLIVSMSPVVEMDDLLEELNTVAVALGIVIGRDELAFAA